MDETLRQILAWCFDISQQNMLLKAELDTLREQLAAKEPDAAQ
jgi:hypothetical protein